LAIGIEKPVAVDVSVTDTSLCVELNDGRSITAPLEWYPRLLHGNAEERNNWRFIADGDGIHWPDLDEDISMDGLLAGRPSGESQASIRRWLAERSS